MDGWQGMSAADLGRGIAAGEVGPVALTERFLSAIDAHPLAPRIFARMTPDRALAEAEAAEKRATAGLRRGPLDGVPVSWKDLFDTAGVATEAGTALMKGRTPDRDAEVLRRATEAGTICLGKTHLSEIAFSGLGYNPVTATPPCVNDAEAVPGGSSSGAAASVAFGLTPLAIGSDTGGSVRLPAAWNDLVGFKPTHGVLPLTGAVPLCASLDTVGPLARTVEDAALAFAALGGPTVDLRGADLRGLRFLICGTVLMEDVEDAPAAAFADAVGALKRAGAIVETADVPFVTDAYALSATLYAGEAWAFWGPRVEADPDAMFHQIRERVSAGREISAATYLRAWDALRAHRRDWAARTAGYDAVICPTAPLLPPKLARLIADDAYYKSSNLKTLRNTRLANLMGLPALSLPAGAPSCGLMLNGAPGRDGHLLRIAAAAEVVLA